MLKFILIMVVKSNFVVSVDEVFVSVTRRARAFCT